MTLVGAILMSDFEFKIGGYTFKGIYLAIFLPLLSSIAGGVWAVSDFYNKITGLEGKVLSNSAQEAHIDDLSKRLLIVEQTMADSSLNELQGKLAQLGANLTAIMEAQKELLGLKDQFKDIDVSAKENALLVQSYEKRIQELEARIKIYQTEIDDLWKGLDALATPYG
jgi:uncharacterized coiled-coil protein SlyX